VSQVTESARPIPASAGRSRGEDGGAPVGGVHVEPQALGGGDVRDGCDRVDRAGGGGAGGRHDRERQPAAGAVLADCRGQRGGVEL
jgi:hypothetical protein